MTSAGSRGPVRVTVPLGARSYDVVVGHGLMSELAPMLPQRARRVAVVSQSGNPMVGALDLDVPHETFLVPHGEQGKTLATVETLCRGFVRMGLTRDDCVLGIGGGLVTDVAGFAASMYHRGVAVAHLATTLLAMVDAAIGGKTGVNLAEGKNLIGSFWQPCGVVCDLDALTTLPEREMRCGLGEMAKYHFLTGDDLLALDMVQRVARCVAIKAEVVGADEREGGRRATLNYGHTLAHALEIATDHEMAHGEAVAVGLCYAARLAQHLGRIDDARVAEHDRVVGDAYGLSTALPEGLDRGSLIELMGRDKKAVDGYTFVLDGARGVEVVSGVAPRTMEAALEAMPR